MLSSSKDRTESLLLLIAAIFVLSYSVALSISPAVRVRSWPVDLAWRHWLGSLVWLVGFYFAHRESCRRLPNRDPYILPIAALLTGWGLMSIFRLFEYFGLRQTLWLALSLGIFTLGLRLPGDMRFFRQYKYIWLTIGLLLTGLTLILGTNPMGYGPRMWLGCCGVYFQPSEPLKLLLIVYLAAYLAGFHFESTDSTQSQAQNLSPDARIPILPLLAPTLILTGLAIGLLLVQRDLGTASIFLFLYAAIIYLATGRRRVPLFSLLAIILAAIAGYLLFDVVRVRIDAWINPWLDPSGRSYQIVQSLLAIANGGLLGRGPGMGNPNLVPVPHSDFIYAALAEEFGLLGTIALLVAISVFCVRGFVIALRASEPFKRYLSAGLTAYLVGQSILIIAGNLRLLPLTGVTLPFISYGGSSLLISFISLLLILHISDQPDDVQPAALPKTQPFLYLSGILLLGLAATATIAGWWSFYRGPDLLTRTDNARRSIADRQVKRGSILESQSQPVAETVGEPGDFTRLYQYPALSPVVGYTHPVYGQSGLEASMDDYLRGIQGNPDGEIWWQHLLYGQPPAGRDIRISIDARLQEVADIALQNHLGALVLLDAENGDILVMASHPNYDANRLDETWQEIIQNEDAPLLNRATLGRYPIGNLTSRLLLDEPGGMDWQANPLIRLPTGDPPDAGASEITFSPFQMALAASALSAGGARPAPQIVKEVDTYPTGWVLLPPLSQPLQVVPEEIAYRQADQFRITDQNLWQMREVVPNGPDDNVSWYIAGTHPDWSGPALALAVLLEEDNPDLAGRIGQTLLDMAIRP